MSTIKHNPVDDTIQLTEHEKQHLQEIIDAAIDSECSYEKDNISNAGWDFLQNKVPDILLNKLSTDYKIGDFEFIEDIDEDVAYRYLQSEINDYEEEYGNIRSYKGY